MSEVNTLPEQAPQKELVLQQLWDEKKNRPEIDELQGDTLVIALSEPIFSTDDVVDLLRQGISQFSSEQLYNWSKRWGQTRVALSPYEESVGALTDIRTDDSKKYLPLLTSPKRPPGEYFCNESLKDNTNFQIVINDEPTTYEGAVLQIERMVDETVWSIAQRDNVKPKDYSPLMLDVLSGIEITYANEDEIAQLLANNSDIDARVYGNFHHHDAIPPLIGCVIPSDHEAFRTIGGPPNGRYLMKKEATSSGRSRLEIPRNNTERMTNPNHVVTFGLTLTKQPHVGHLFQLANADMLASINGVEFVVIHGNDRGPRIDSTIETGEDQTRLDAPDILKLIKMGHIALGEIDGWYKSRDPDRFKNIFESNPEFELDSHAIAEEHRWIFSSFSAKEVYVVPECEVPASSYDQFVAGDSSGWSESGFAVFQESTSSKKVVLTKRGIPTPTLHRAAHTDYVMDSTGAQVLLYVDSDERFQDAYDLVSQFEDKDVIQVPGAGIGFGGAIASSTEGDSINLIELSELLPELGKSDEATSAIYYLMYNRPMLARPGQQRFFDFKDKEAFVTGLQEARFELDQLLSGLDSSIAKLEQNEEFNTSTDIAPGRLDFLIRRVQKSLYKLEGRAAIDLLGVNQIEEEPRVKSRIHKLSSDGSKDKYSQLADVLEVVPRIAGQSTLCGLLSKMGYRSEAEQIRHLRWMSDQDAELITLRGFVFTAADNALELSEAGHLLSKDEKDQLLQLLKKLRSWL